MYLARHIIKNQNSNRGITSKRYASVYYQIYFRRFVIYIIFRDRILVTILYEYIDPLCMHFYVYFIHVISDSLYLHTEKYSTGEEGKELLILFC